MQSGVAQRVFRGGVAPRLPRETIRETPRKTIGVAEQLGHLGCDVLGTEDTIRGP